MISRQVQICVLLLVLVWSNTTANADGPGVTSDAANAERQPTREQILSSADWRRAMFEVNEWLMTQNAYTPAQVEEVRTDFRNRVAAMSAAELSAVLADLKTKLQILEAPQVQEARAWMAEYVAVLSDRKRNDVLRDLPNLATLTSEQLHREVLRIKEKRASIDRRQSAFSNSQSQRIAAQSQAQPAETTRRSRPATFSPYRSQSTVNDRLNTAPNNRPSFFVDAWGGVGRALPSAW